MWSASGTAGMSVSLSSWTLGTWFKDSLWVNSGEQRAQPSPRIHPHDGEGTHPSLGFFGVGFYDFFKEPVLLKSHLLPYLYFLKVGVRSSDFKTWPHYFLAM